VIDVHSAVRASAAGHSAADAISAAMNLISALSMAYRSALTKRGGVDGAPRLASQFNEFSEFLGVKMHAFLCPVYWRMGETGTG